MDYHRKLAMLGALPRPVRRAVMISRYRREIGRDGEPELPHLAALLRPGDLAIDVGANLGTYAYELGRITGNVVAFEPNPTLAAFVDGLRLPGVRQVNQVALAEAPGTAVLSVPPFDTGYQAASLAPIDHPSDDERITVQVQTLDAQGLVAVRFIKIDVEGFEEAVLDGAVRLIERDRPTLLVEIEERHNAGGIERVSERLAELGYSGSFLLEGAWQPLSRFSLDEHQPGGEAFWSQARHLKRRQLPYVNNFLFTHR